MKYAIGLFLILFIVINPAKSQNEGNATQSNETVTTRTEGLVVTVSGKDNSADQKIEVTTVSTVEDSLASNVTQEHGQNHSLAENKDIKEENTTINNTTKAEENTTINNTTKDENETINNTTKDENETINNTTKYENETIYNKTKENSVINATATTIAKDVTTTEHPTDNDTNPVTTSRTSLKPLEHKNYCQSYIDNLLNSTLSNHAHKLDPLKLEDRAISFDTNSLLGSVKSELGLIDGKVTGMSKGKSTGKCIVQIKNEQAILKSIISFDGAELSYKGKATFINFGPTVIVRGELSGSSVELHIAVPKDGGTGEIKRLRVKNIGRLTVEVKGLGPIGSTVGLVSEEMVNVFRLNFRRSIEKELRNAMEDEIKKITYP